MKSVLLSVFIGLSHSLVSLKHYSGLAPCAYFTRCVQEAGSNTLFSGADVPKGNDGEASKRDLESFRVKEDTKLDYQTKVLEKRSVVDHSSAIPIRYGQLKIVIDYAIDNFLSPDASEKTSLSNMLYNAIYDFRAQDDANKTIGFNFLLNPFSSYYKKNVSMVNFYNILNEIQEIMVGLQFIYQYNIDLPKFDLADPKTIDLDSFKNNIKDKFENNVPLDHENFLEYSNRLIDEVHEAKFGFSSLHSFRLKFQGENSYSKIKKLLVSPIENIFLKDSISKVKRYLEEPNVPGEDKIYNLKSKLSKAIKVTRGNTEQLNAFGKSLAEYFSLKKVFKGNITLVLKQ